MSDTGHDEQHGKSAHKKAHAGAGHGGGGSHEEHEGAPEWLISFADNTALMMGLFVIMLALTMAKVDESAGSGESSDGQSAASAEMLDFVISVREAFNNPVDIGSSDPRDASLVKRLKDRSENPIDQPDAPRGKNDRAQSMRPSDFYTLSGTVPFDDASSILTPTARAAAADAARRVRGMRWIVEVRGHTSAAETFRQVEKGMRLSYDRAWSVADAMAENGVPWDQIRLVACADGEPIVQRAADAQGHLSNQRVEVLITQELVPDDPFTKDRLPSPSTTPEPGRRTPPDGAAADENDRGH